MRYCSRCTYPLIAVNLDVDDEGVCSSCRSFEAFDELTPDFWAERKKTFERLVEEIKGKNDGNYDCVIPVSGGKDSYYQIHMMAKEYGLKPLLVPYHGNNYLPEGAGAEEAQPPVLPQDGRHELARALRHHDLAHPGGSEVQRSARHMGRDRLGHLR